MKWIDKIILNSRYQKLLKAPSGEKDIDRSIREVDIAIVEHKNRGRYYLLILVTIISAFSYFIWYSLRHDESQVNGFISNATKVNNLYHSMFESYATFKEMSGFLSDLRSSDITLSEYDGLASALLLALTKADRLGIDSLFSKSVPSLLDSVRNVRQSDLSAAQSASYFTRMELEIEKGVEEMAQLFSFHWNSEPEILLEYDPDKRLVGVDYSYWKAEVESVLKEQESGVKLIESQSMLVYLVFAAFTLLFGVFTSMYRSEQRVISLLESNKLGFLRIRIAANNHGSEGFKTEVRQILTNNAFADPMNGEGSSSRSIIGKKKIENPLPGHPGLDLATTVLNKVFDSFELDIKPKKEEK